VSPTRGTHPEARRALGRRAEDLAAAWLGRHGARVVARNLHLRHAELDLVALDGDALCFVEVRARTGAGFGSAFESVDARKQRRIARAAAEALARLPWPRHQSVRFDVVAVDFGAAPPAIEWLRDAFHVK
jgi:putative endonuclease